MHCTDSFRHVKTEREVKLAAPPIGLGYTKGPRDINCKPEFLLAACLEWNRNLVSDMGAQSTAFLCSIWAEICMRPCRWVPSPGCWASAILRIHLKGLEGQVSWCFFGENSNQGHCTSVQSTGPAWPQDAFQPNADGASLVLGNCLAKGWSAGAHHATQYSTGAGPVSGKKESGRMCSSLHETSIRMQNLLQWQEGLPSHRNGWGRGKKAEWTCISDT